MTMANQRPTKSADVNNVIRVLHVSSGNLYGGIEKLLATLARNRNLSPTIQSELALCFDGRLAAEIRAIGTPLHLLGGVRVRRPLTLFRARRRLQALIQRGRFDLVVCHSVWPLAIFGSVFKASGRPFVLWLHDYPTGPHWLERWARLARPGFVICNSHSTAEHVGAICPGAPLRVLYYPVELIISDGPIAARSKVRDELGTPAKSTVIVQVSRMESWKGHILHLEALKQLSEVPDWMCWIVGGPQRAFEEKYYKELRRLAVRNGIETRVRFLGFRSDIPDLLAAADLFCQPNRSPEPFGIAFIEALLSGLPVITTDMGGAKEIVHSSCGILVPADDASALAIALRKLITDKALRGRLSVAAQGRGRTLCDLQSGMDALARLFYEVAA